LGPLAQLVEHFPF